MINNVISFAKVTELRLFGLGSKGRRPILMARLADHEVSRIFLIICVLTMVEQT